MPRPTQLPEWDTSGANILEPSAGKKAAGWLAGERPPSGWWNWWQRLVYDWVKWIDDESEGMQLRAEKAALSSGASMGASGSQYAMVFAINPATGFVIGLGRIGATGESGYIYDASTWANTTSGASGTQNDAHWDGALFQSVGTEIRSSPTGIDGTWTVRLTSTGLGYVSMASNPSGVRVALKYAGGIARSTNGTTWVETTPAGDWAGNGWRKIVWDAVHSQFVVIFPNGNCKRSSDGLTWTDGAATGLTAAAATAVYFERLGAVVMVGSNGTNTICKYTLDAGVTWITAGVSLSGTAPRRLFASRLAVYIAGAADATFKQSARLLDVADWSDVRKPLADVVTNGASEDYENHPAFLAAPPIGLQAFFMFRTGGSCQVWRSALLGAQ